MEKVWYVKRPKNPSTTLFFHWKLPMFLLIIQSTEQKLMLALNLHEVLLIHIVLSTFSRQKPPLPIKDEGQFHFNSARRIFIPILWLDQGHENTIIIIIIPFRLQTKATLFKFHNFQQSWSACKDLANSTNSSLLLTFHFQGSCRPFCPPDLKNQKTRSVPGETDIETFNHGLGSS